MKRWLRRQCIRKALKNFCRSIKAAGRLALEHRLPLLTIPGVLNFFEVGKIFVPIDDAEIAAIKIAVQSQLRTEPCTFPGGGQPGTAGDRSFSRLGRGSYPDISTKTTCSRTYRAKAFNIRRD